jgi:hypothetical protein
MAEKKGQSAPLITGAPAVELLPTGVQWGVGPHSPAVSSASVSDN